MTDALATAFEKTKAAGHTAFIPFVTAGFPRLDSTVDILLALEASGADIIEVGMPFSDPLADGGTIQAANTVALRNGVTMEICLGYVKEARDRGLSVPVILMTYYNPILRYGEERLAARCKECESRHAALDPQPRSFSRLVACVWWHSATLTILAYH